MTTKIWGWLAGLAGVAGVATYIGVAHQQAVRPPEPAPPVADGGKAPGPAQVATAAPEKAEAPPAAKDALPTFDIVRVEPSGDAVIAGQGPARATVELMRNGVSFAKTVADAGGQWVIVPPQLPGGAAELMLRATTPDGKAVESEQAVAVGVPQKSGEQVVVVISSPNAPSKVLSAGNPKPAAPKVAAAEPVKPKVEAAKVEPVKPEPPKVEVAVVEPVKPEPPKVEAAKVEPIKPEPPKVEAAKVEPVKPEPPKVEAAKVEPVKPEPPKVEAAKAEPIKPEPPKVEAAKVEPVKPEPPKVEAVRVEPVKPEPPKAEVAKVEPVKPEPPKVEVAKVEPVKPEPPKVEVAKVEPPKVEAPKVVATASETAARADARIRTVEADDAGRFFVTGTAQAGADIRIYLNDAPVTNVTAATDGSFSLTIEKGMKPGDYRVRVDDVETGSGKVLTRAEVPFVMEAKAKPDVPVVVARVEPKTPEPLATRDLGVPAKPAPVVEAARPAEPVAEVAKPVVPVVEASKPAEPVVEAAKPAAPVVEAAKPAEPVVEAAKPAAPVIEAAKPAEPVVEVAKPAAPVIGATKPAEPVVEAAKPAAPVIEAAKPAEPVVEAAKPAAPVVEAAKPAAPVVEAAKPAEPVVEAAKPVEPVTETPAKKPVVLATRDLGALALPKAPVKPAEPPKPVEVAAADATPAPDPTRPPSTAVIAEIKTTTIVRGDNLWRLSRRTYGRGIRYTWIYDANTDQIRDPHWIYPGQIFVMPAKKEL